MKTYMSEMCIHVNRKCLSQGIVKIEKIFDFDTLWLYIL